MRPIVSRIFRVLAVACGTAIVAAIVLAILDLYLTGHGFASLSRPLITWPAAGVSLSCADCAWYAAIVASAILAWWRLSI